jgi:hypothetical protein
MVLADTSGDGSRDTISSAPSAVVMRAPEAPDIADGTSTAVLPFLDQPDTPVDIPAPSASVSGAVAHVSSLEFLANHIQTDLQVKSSPVAGLAHDGAWRDAMVDEMRKGGQSHTDAELVARLAQAADLRDRLAKSTGKARPMKRAQTVEVVQVKKDARSGLVMGEVKLLVPASAEQIVAFLMHFDSKFFQSQHDPKVDVRNEILEVKNLHYKVALGEKKIAPGFANRIFLNALVWERISDTPLTYLWATVPLSHHDKLPMQQQAQAVRADVQRVLQLTCVGGQTRVEYCCSIDLKGHVPQWVMTEIAIPELLRLPYTLQTYFTHVMPTVECTAQLCSKRSCSAGAGLSSLTPCLPPSLRRTSALRSSRPGWRNPYRRSTRQH